MYGKNDYIVHMAIGMSLVLIALRVIDRSTVDGIGDREWTTTSVSQPQECPIAKHYWSFGYM
jgi:hypothetical protein